MRALFGLCLLLHSGVAGAQARRSDDAPPPRALPTAAAVVPGVVVHGAGHFALGQSKTAKNLLLMESLGLGLFLGGGLTIVFTGASRYFVGPAAGSTIVGFGLFSTSYLADIYGTVSSDGGAALSRYRGPARWETELGYRRIHDPQFAHTDFLYQRVSRQIGHFRLTPSGWFSTAGDTARYRVEGQYRLAGNVHERRPGDQSFVDLTLGFVHQRHRPEHFSKGSAELSVDGRYDMGRLGPTLRGSFIELGLGYGIGRLDYDLQGLSVPTDIEHLLLARIGFGVTLRGLSAPGSEWLVYYDHRHDDYVAGLKLTGLGSGVAGHFGTTLRWFATESLGVAVDAQAGSAYLAGASLVYRQGGNPR
ncbi:MAG: hypothetical protein EOO73_03630 [Myxococcales bacterium]|nr:MAG: hypothetical protein EOO73_03630 [Myxococcales bacterium]